MGGIIGKNAILQQDNEELHQKKLRIEPKKFAQTKQFRLFSDFSTEWETNIRNTALII